MSKINKQEVYNCLAKIPEGTVATYGMIAELLGNKRWARAVGNILHENPDGDRYPCYRVVTWNGKLSESYAFGGIECQKRRLERDGIEVVDNRVDLKKYRWQL